MRSIQDIAILGKTVGIRVDYNVPLRTDGSIADDARIRAALPTIQYAIAQRARVILFSHLGRPKGKKDARYTLAPVAQRLRELLKCSVLFANDCIGDDVARLKETVQVGEVLLLENLRFYPQEEDNDLAFAQELARGLDVYIDDAFGAIHRAHASIVAITQYVPESGVGFLIEKELNALDRIAEGKKLGIVMGGAKMSDKIGMITRLAAHAQSIACGGALANAFFAAQGIDIAASVVDAQAIALAREVLHNPHIAEKIMLPSEVVVAHSVDADASASRVITIGRDKMASTEMILDLAPSSVDRIVDIFSSCDALFWNGPIGVYEHVQFAAGSRRLAQGIEASGTYSVIGGGDTEACVRVVAPESSFSHISTGGGASLEYLSGAPLPGLQVLE